MAKEEKTVSVPVAEQQKKIAAMKKDKWEHMGFGFADEGPTHVALLFERPKK